MCNIPSSPVLKNNTFYRVRKHCGKAVFPLGKFHCLRASLLMSPETSLALPAAPPALPPRCWHSPIRPLEAYVGLTLSWQTHAENPDVYTQVLSTRKARHVLGCHGSFIYVFLASLTYVLDLMFQTAPRYSALLSMNSAAGSILLLTFSPEMKIKKQENKTQNIRQT